MDIIKTEGLTKLYRNGRGVKDLNLTVQKGEVFGLLGPNGSGKTTTFKILAGLLRQNSGNFEIFGGAEHKSARAKMGVMIENPALYPYMTAYEMLEAVSVLYEKIRPDQITKALDDVGLSEYADEKIKAFSLGMKQRLALALALLHRPELYILDEPTNGLDIIGTAEIRRIIKGEAERGKTILISSHIANEMELICSKIGLISDGQLIRVEYIDDVLRDYGSVEEYYISNIQE